MLTEQVGTQCDGVEVDSRPYAPNSTKGEYLGGRTRWISEALIRRRRGEREIYLKLYIESIAGDAPDAEPFDSDLEFDPTGMVETDSLIIYDSSRDRNPFGIPETMPVE